MTMKNRLIRSFTIMIGAILIASSQKSAIAQCSCVSVDTNTTLCTGSCSPTVDSCASCSHCVSYLITHAPGPGACCVTQINIFRVPTDPGAPHCFVACGPGGTASKLSCDSNFENINFLPSDWCKAGDNRCLYICASSSGTLEFDVYCSCDEQPCRILAYIP